MRGKQDQNLGFRRTDVVQFRDLYGRILWEVVLEKRRVLERSLIFRVILFQAQLLTILKSGRKHAWINKFLLINFRHKNEST